MDYQKASEAISVLDRYCYPHEMQHLLGCLKTAYDNFEYSDLNRYSTLIYNCLWKDTPHAQNIDHWWQQDCPEPGHDAPERFLSVIFLTSGTGDQTEADCENVYFIALLHDVGKIGVPDAILKKQDKLTPEEYEMMKNHTIVGAHILKDIKMLPGLCEGTLYHHERYDCHPVLPKRNGPGNCTAGTEK